MKNSEEKTEIQELKLIEDPEYIRSNSNFLIQFFSQTLEKRDTTLSQIVESLESTLTHENPAERGLGTRFLVDVLQALPLTQINDEELKFLTAFFTDRLKDHHSVVPHVIVGIMALVRQTNISSEDVKSLVTAVFREVPCQMQVVSDRRNIFNLLKFCVLNKLKEMSEMKVEFIVGFISAVEGEKDPRNLLLLFSFFPLVTGGLTLEGFAEDMFEVVAAYFPIDFVPPASDPYGVLPEDLSQGLRGCLTSTVEFAPFSIPFLQEKLDSDLLATKMDTLLTLEDCCRSYPATALRPHVLLLWGSLRRAVVEEGESGIGERALAALGELVGTLQRGVDQGQEASPARKSIEDGLVQLGLTALSECLPHLQSPEQRLMEPSSQLLLASCTHSKLLTRMMAEKVFPLLVEQYGTKTEPAARKNTVQVLAKFLVQGKKQNIFEEGSPFSKWRERSFELLLEAVGHIDTRVAGVGISALALSAEVFTQKQRGEAVRLLAELMPSSSPDLRSEMVCALASFGKTDSQLLLDHLLPSLLQQLRTAPIDHVLTSVSAVCESSWKCPSGSVVREVLPLLWGEGRRRLREGSYNASQYFDCIKKIVEEGAAEGPSWEFLLKEWRGIVQCQVLALNAIRSGHPVDLLIPALERVSAISRALVLGATGEDCKDAHVMLQVLLGRGAEHDLPPLPKSLTEEDLSVLCLWQAGGDTEGSLKAEMKTSALLVYCLRGLLAGGVLDTLSPETTDGVIFLLKGWSVGAEEDRLRDHAGALFALLLLNISSEAELKSTLNGLQELNFAVHPISNGNSTVGVISPAASPNAVNFLGWVVKGLIMRAYPGDESWVRKLEELLLDAVVGNSASRCYQFLLKEVPWLTFPKGAQPKTFRMLYKQRFFERRIESLVEQFRNREGQSKMNTLMAISHLLPCLPQIILKGHIKKLLPVLAIGLTCGDLTVTSSTVETLSSLLRHNVESVTSHVSTLVPPLLDMTAQTPITVRVKSLECLEALAQLPPHTIVPMKQQVCHLHPDVPAHDAPMGGITFTCGRDKDSQPGKDETRMTSKGTSGVTSSTIHTDATAPLRASRRVSKCGYLFVAPDWDFTNPLNRTKRWQRRWFVLFDDGELTYSVDDLPATIPQGVIDMNRVLEVSEAEEVTGNQFSLGITSPDGVTFVKGTSREESRWWREVLSVFPRTQHKHNGRYKRNATFPGIKSSSCVLQQSRTTLGRTSSPSLAPPYDHAHQSQQRIRFHSCASDSFNVGRPSSAPTLGGQEDVFPIKDPPPQTTSPASSPTPVYHSTPLTSLPPSTRLLNEEHKENTPPYLQDYHDNPPTSESPPTQDKVLGHRPRTRRTAKREARGLTQPRSKSEVSLLPPFASSPATNHQTPASINPLKEEFTNNAHNEEFTNRRGYRRWTSVTSSLSMTSLGGAYVSPFVIGPPLKEAESPLLRPGDGVGLVDVWREGTKKDFAPSRIQYSDFPSVKRFLTSSLIRNSGDLSHHLIMTDFQQTKRDEKLKDIADSITRPPFGSSSLPYIVKENGVKPTRDGEAPQGQHKSAQHPADDVTDSVLHEHIRGDPDGCGLDGEPSRLSAGTDTQRVELPAEDVLHMKKGWLMKRGFSQEWSKHWFVLEGAGLKFFRDPGAEDNGILDGIIDLGLVKDVQEKEVGRNYGFVVTTWDDKKYIFCAVTSGIRTNWVQAMRNGANLREPQGRPLTLGEKLEKEMGANKDTSNGSPVVSPITDVEVEETAPVVSTTSSRLHISSDDDYKTASDSSFFRDYSRDGVINFVDRLTRSSLRGSPSSPVTRSRSSPPVSRRGTREDFPSSSTPANASACLSETDSLQSVLGLGNLTPEKDSNGTLASTGEGMLVELLETQVESLKAKLEETQENYLELHKENVTLRDRLSSSTSSKTSRNWSGPGKRLYGHSNTQGQNYDQLTDLRSQISRQEEEIKEKNKVISRIEVIRKQLEEERREWEGRLGAQEEAIKELKTSEAKHGEIVRKLTRSLKEAEQKVNFLTQELSKAEEARTSYSKRTETEVALRIQSTDLKKQAKDLTVEVARLKENLKGEKSEVYKWKDLVKELRSLLDGRNDDMEMKREEVHNLREKLKQTQNELDSTADRLHRGIEENENLCCKLRELERQTQGKGRRGSSNLCLSNSREKCSSSSPRKALPRMDSLSDLTNIDLHLHPEDLEKECLEEEYTELRIRFEKAVGEIRALRKEVRSAQTLQDNMELTNQRLKTDFKAQQEDFNAQIQLMGTRVQDLTTKLNNSEKQVRTLKQKVSRGESRDRRRTLSLKGKDTLVLSKDLEAKLAQLEGQVADLLKEDTAAPSGEKLSSVCEASRSKSFEEAARRSRLRRKSLDGQTTEKDTIKTALRVSALEDRISSLTGKDLKKGSNTSLSSCSNADTTSSNNPTAHLNVNSVSRSKSPLVSPLRSPATPRKISSSRTPKGGSTDKNVKVTRSESESKLLREKITALEYVLSTLQAKLSECETCAKALECVCCCRGASESLPRLRELLTSASHLTQHRHSQCDQTAVRRARPLALHLQDLLKEKANQLAQRRHQLRAVGKWTREAQLKGLAERLGFEAVLVSQVAQAMQAGKDPSSFEASLRLQELIEAHRKLSFLEKKLASPEFDMEPLTPLEFYSSLLAEKLTVEGDVLDTLTTGSVSSLRRRPSVASTVVNETCKDLLTKVLDRERRLEGSVTRYKEEKLQEVAVVMARDTLSGSSPTQEEPGDGVLPEELRLREAWGMAQDILTQEVANLEASQSVLRLAHLLGPPSEGERCVATHMSAVALERLLTGAEDSLRQEMEESVFTLSRKYEEALSLIRGGDSSVLASVRGVELEVVLGEFAAVLAQKALIDGQLAVATGDPSPATAPIEEPPSAVVEPLIDAAGDVAASESHLLMFLGGGDADLERRVTSALDQAEFSFLYGKVASDATEIVNAFSREPPPQGSGDSHTDSHSRIPPSSPKSPRRRAIDPLPSRSSRSRRSSDVTGMTEPSSAISCRQCEDLRQEISRLKRVWEGRRLKKQETECKKCSEYLQTFQHLQDDHRTAMEALQSQHRAEIDRLRDQVKYDPPTRDSDDELTELKRRLCLLEEGYEAQIAALKKQYQEALGSQSDICEENIRQRYQLEIDHLRELCEKGLTAMESSHRRLVAEMEEKHAREMDQLRADKEEALAEETQATLAALDAMRKAHEAEVQKEVSKFKEEFLRRAGGSGPEGEAAHARLHEQEVREVRREILALSEKYSGKCLEVAAKEQKVDSLLRQLTEAKAQARALEERNRLLKQRLNGHLQSTTPSSDKSAADLQREFEWELALKDEEIADLNQMLQKSKMHESDLGSLCGQLGQFLKSEKSLDDKEAILMRDSLENRIMAAVNIKGENRSFKPRRTPAEESCRASLRTTKSSAKKEVSRSPSCPGLSGFSPLLWKGARESQGRAPSPLMGMVAQRKKVFEGPPTTKSEC